VLAIYMGGMAVGAWLAARYSFRWRNLLLAYALAESLVGLAGLVFHQVFTAAVSLSYESIIPMLDSSLGIQLMKWSLAASLILPQSVLLGMTFPLMSGALVRRFPDSSGNSIALLYFTNSIGAAVGTLVSGFVLLAWVGLPGTIMTAGILNVALALFVWLLARDGAWNQTPTMAAAASAARRIPAPARLLLTTALVTGAASFMYEIGWIRLLSLVLGASTHAFELMLSAFVFGLALGALWIRRRIQGLRNPLRFLGLIQIVMGVLAAATLVVYGMSFDVMALAMETFTKTDAGYAAFNLTSHGIALAVMLPVTFCAGMTLPLITHILVQSGHGESSIGRVYAANTLGAIVGVLAAVHLLMPLVGLKGLMLAGACADLTLGIVLVYYADGAPRIRTAAACIGLGLLAATAALVELDPARMASGVFRHGKSRIGPHARVVHHQDGKTATVQLMREEPGLLTILTNGKPDAVMAMEPGLGATADEYTMVLLGAIPLAVRPQARSAAIIGFGSGLTTHVMLGSGTLERVDTIEIEPRMVQAAQAFRPRVERAFSDPRSRIHLEDAKTFFATGRTRYEIIVSEPSNPWVSGVASLYTKEFYHFVRNHLDENGVFAQWLHFYEMDRTLVSSVIKALGNAFPSYAIYSLTDMDVLIVAGTEGSLALQPEAVLAYPELRRALSGIGVESAQDLHALRLGTRRWLDPWLRGQGVPANSDYFPLLDLNAVRSRYLKRSPQEVLRLGISPMPLGDLLDPLRVDWERTALTGRSTVLRVRAAREAMKVRDWFAAADPTPGSAPKDRAVLTAELMWQSCAGARYEQAWIDSLLNLATLVVPYLRPQELDGIWRHARACDGRLNEHQRAWMRVVEAVSARDAQAMSTSAEELLERGTEHDRPQRRAYLLAVAMLGQLARGNDARARDLMNRHSHNISGERPLISTLEVLTAMSLRGY